MSKEDPKMQAKKTGLDRALEVGALKVHSDGTKRLDLAALLETKDGFAYLKGLARKVKTVPDTKK